MTKRSVRCHLEPVGQTSEELSEYIAGEAVRMIGDIGYGVTKFSKEDMPMVAQMLRVHQGSSRAGQVRHFVISPDRRRDQKQTWELVQKICHPLIKVHAPDRYWLLGYHVGTATDHGHLAVANVGPDGKALRFDLEKFLSILDLKFTDVAVSSRGRGRKKGVRVHPKAKNLKVRDLARDLVGPEGQFRRSLYKQMRQDGRIALLRRNKSNGFVFTYEKMEIGSKTLRYFLNEKTRRSRSMVLGELSRELVRGDGQFHRDHCRAMRRSGQLARSRSATGFTYEFRTIPISGDELSALLKDAVTRRRPTPETRTPPRPVLRVADIIAVVPHKPSEAAASAPPLPVPSAEPTPEPLPKQPPVKVPTPPARAQALPLPPPIQVVVPPRPVLKTPALPPVIVTELPLPDETDPKAGVPKRPLVRVPASSAGTPPRPVQPASPEPQPPVPKRSIVKVPPITPTEGPTLPEEDDFDI